MNSITVASSRTAKLANEGSACAGKFKHSAMRLFISLEYNKSQSVISRYRCCSSLAAHVTMPTASVQSACKFHSFRNKRRELGNQPTSSQEDKKKKHLIRQTSWMLLSDKFAFSLAFGPYFRVFRKGYVCIHESIRPTSYPSNHAHLHQATMLALWVVSLATFEVLSRWDAPLGVRMAIAVFCCYFFGDHRRLLRPKRQETPTGTGCEVIPGEIPISCRCVLHPAPQRKGVHILGGPWWPQNSRYEINPNHPSLQSCSSVFVLGRLPF